MADLDKLFAQAAAIAQKLPENLQEAAFNRALDELLGGPKHGSSARTKKSSGRTKNVKPEKNTAQTESNDFIDAIDRTKYPDIGSTNRVADRALKVLHLANEDLGIDGLSASQIAEALTKKFRLPATTAAIRMALQREAQTVDVRASQDGRNRFHIMAPGDDYLEKLRAGEIDPRIQKRRKATKKKSVAPKKSANKKKAGVKESYSIDRNLDLRGDKSIPSFKDFNGEKQPKSAKEFNAVAVYYLRKILGLSEIGLDQAYTCYKEVSRKPPQAFRQSFIDTKNKNGWVEFTAEDHLEIPHRGAVFVEHDLPKSK